MSTDTRINDAIAIFESLRRYLNQAIDACQDEILNSIIEPVKVLPKSEVPFDPKVYPESKDKTKMRGWVEQCVENQLISQELAAFIITKNPGSKVDRAKFVWVQSPDLNNWLKGTIADTPEYWRRVLLWDEFRTLRGYGEEVPKRKVEVESKDKQTDEPIEDKAA